MLGDAKTETHCGYCNAVILKYPRQIQKQTFCYCNRTCYHSHMKILQSGMNNSNYNNKWSPEQKAIASARTTALMTDERRTQSGNANRGKKFSRELIEKMHGNRDSGSYSHPHNEETLQLLGRISKERWADPERKRLKRIVMEERGWWVPIHQKTDYQIYFKEADWTSKMWDIVESSLIYSIGIFHKNTNPKGAVRDHMFGRKSGFDEGVFPEILRHPANCQIISHSDNVKKKAKRYVDKNDISLDDLFDAIVNYTGLWAEQLACIEKIKQYKDGLRWVRDAHSINPTGDNNETN